MSGSDDPFDRLADDLARTEFDAVERDGLRAAWSDDGLSVVVSALDGEESVTYGAEELVRAASAREVRHAREPTESPGTRTE